MMLMQAVKGLLIGLVATLAIGTWGAGPAVAQEDHTSPPAHSTSATAEADGHDDAAHGAPGDGPLTFKNDLAIWTAVVFLLVLAVLWKFAWRPILSGLDKRERGIADNIAEADRANQQAREILDRYEQRLAQSEDEVRKILDEAKRDAQKLGKQMIDKAQEEARNEKDRAVADIELATADALKELAERSATLAVGLAGQIVKKRLDPSGDAALIEEAMNQFGAKGEG